MAIIIFGQTKCSLCKLPLEEKQEVSSFPHFLKEGHQLWAYSDSGMHTACIETWEHKDEFLLLYKTVRRDHLFTESAEMKEMIRLHGIPDWIKEDVKEFGMPNWLQEFWDSNEKPDLL